MNYKKGEKDSVFTESFKNYMKVTNIIWDVDCEEDLRNLPAEIKIPEGMDEDEIADYLSDVTGYCHKGFMLED